MLENKIYIVIKKDIHLDMDINRIMVNVFINKENAREYLKYLIKEIKQENISEENEDFYSEETDLSYTLYPDGVSGDEVSVWIEEDEICDFNTIIRCNEK